MTIGARRPAPDPSRPVAAPVPAPGIYWLRVLTAPWDQTRAMASGHLDIPTGYDWSKAHSCWIVAEVLRARGDYDIIGSDAGCLWTDESAMVVEVGAKLEPQRALPENTLSVEEAHTRLRELVTTRGDHPTHTDALHALVLRCQRA